MKYRSEAAPLKLLALVTLFCLGAPAFAHVSATHGVHGFEAGFLHPLLGVDHLLAMLAIGIWAAQHKGKAFWILPLVFPLAMMAGAWLGIQGVQIPGVEGGIAVSVLILGLLIAAAIKLPLLISAVLVSLFALAHGYAHGIEIAAGASAIWFVVGFVFSTALLHASGLLAALSVNRFLSEKMNRVAGAAIAMTGLFFVAALT
ncbi:HupE/UreJ family protein [Undibacterium sp. Di27W]|uniref:HupE/UreJ family protein n=1 Tax=Undibacterium sp. Di27W TaxID=3413036 RepID=UPI003BF27DC3